MVPREIRLDNYNETIKYLTETNKSSTLQSEDRESPIFIFSAGWRSGSTLLQRLICSEKNILLWGEPYGDRVPICRLSSSINGLTENDPHIKYSIDKLSGDISKSWIANLNPGTEYLCKAHRAFVDKIFSHPAKENGFDRWGCKWVRLTAYHAQYLKWLYPQSKLLFLVRNPFDAFLSYKQKKWFTVKPHYKVDNVLKFMAHWRYLSESFINERERLGAILVRYESLSSCSTLDIIDSYLGIKVNRNVLSHTVGARDKSKLKLTIYEKLICQVFSSAIIKSLERDYKK